MFTEAETFSIPRSRAPWTTTARAALFLLVIAAGWIPARAASPQHSRFLLGSYRKTMEIEAEIRQACERYDVPLALARSVCMYESGGNASLVSRAGARGYFQVIPSTKRLMKVSSNIEAGVKYLGQMLRLLGREDEALAAYNAGPGRVKKGRPMPVETLQYVVGIGYLRTLLKLDESAIREEASRLLLHTVREGEDWLRVSRATGTSLLELRLYNPYLASRPLRKGQLIAHPPPSAVTPIDRIAAPAEDAGWTYTTLPGDVYLHLAFAFDVPLDRMRSDNDLWRVQAPLAGMTLRIRPGPGEAEDDEGEWHVVVQGESIESIASGYVITPWELIRDNGLWDQTVEPGMLLRLRRASDSGDAEEPEQPPRYITHRVRRGDTLIQLARTYGTTVDRIRGTNGIRGTRLYVGQTIRIPAGSRF
jgi:LysM repeat protein